MQWLNLCVLYVIIVTNVCANQIFGKVIAIRDADTLAVIDDNDLEVWIRLAEIDLPEKFQSHGKISRKALQEKTLLNRVRIVLQGEDPYGRLIGNVFVEDRWINKELVEEGYAWHFIHHSGDTRLAYAEKIARSNKRNLWEEEFPLPPWEFRQKQKAQRVFTISEYLDRRTRVPDAYDAISEQKLDFDLDNRSSRNTDTGEGIAVPSEWLQRGPIEAAVIKKNSTKKGKKSTTTRQTKTPSVAPSRRTSNSFRKK